MRFPADCIEVLRCRPFRFSARSCDKWAVGRVIVCGDAAHVFPPCTHHTFVSDSDDTNVFVLVGGQGIASGFRDAISLSWRLANLCRAKAPGNVEQTLRCWYTERKQQLEASLAATVRNGDMVNSSSIFKIFLRDWGLWLLQMVPPMKRWIELGPRQAGRMRYEHGEGMPFLPEYGGGALFSQGYCVGLSSKGTDVPKVQLTDDVIFSEGKKGVFQIVVLLNKDIDELGSPESDLKGLDKICPLLHPHETSYFIKRSHVHSNPIESPSDVFRTASGEEFDASPLSAGRPPVRGYREYDMWTAAEEKKYVILRADRFVFAACDSRKELEKAAARLNELVLG